jgi:hypothetical protein
LEKTSEATGFYSLLRHLALLSAFVLEQRPPLMRDMKESGMSLRIHQITWTWT